MLSVEARTVLRRMRAKVAEGKWTRLHYHESWGEKACLVGMIEDEAQVAYANRHLFRERALGAIPSVPIPNNTADEVVTAISRALVVRRGWKGGIQPWNDSVALDEGDVIKLIDETMEVDAKT